jgi:hypothetical protein
VLAPASIPINAALRSELPKVGKYSTHDDDACGYDEVAEHRFEGGVLGREEGYED